MVAFGGADVSFEFGIHAWDIAAGDLIVREAGGVSIDPAGKIEKYYVSIKSQPKNTVQDRCQNNAEIIYFFLCQKEVHLM